MNFVADQRRARRTMRVVASHTLQARRIQAAREMLRADFRHVVAFLADIIHSATQQLGIGSTVGDVTCRAVTLSEGRVRLRMAGRIRQRRVTDKARDVIVHIAEQAFAIGRVRVVAGRAQLLFDGRMDAGKTRQRGIEIGMASGAKRLPCGL
jgi:hypothetical protein